MHHEAPVLLAGNRSDIDLIVELLSQLPPGARGQVFLEVDHTAQIEDLREPEDFAVHWLVREEALGMAAPGQRLIDAVTSWVHEWVLPDSPHEERPQLMWVGCGDWPEVTHLCHHLHRSHQDLHLHHAQKF